MVNQKRNISRVITFYSYKGGVGRSMAMANIGVIMAKWGYRTLLIDWDLEAPGIENYFKEYIDLQEVLARKGLIDLLNLKTGEADVNIDEIKWNDYIAPISFEGGYENLHLLTAGKRDESYVQKIRQFDFSSFYKDENGGQYLEDLREYWLDNFDFILIDSRTGLTDSSGICSIHMPDILVLLFTPNEQSFNGIRNVALKAMEGQKQVIFDRFRLRTLPIPSRIENAETILLDEWMKKIYENSVEMFEWLPRNEDSTFQINPAQVINQVKIPYKTFYAYGEKLPALERDNNDPHELGYVYETIAAILANDLQHIHLLSDSRDLLVKKAKGEDVEISSSPAPAPQQNKKLKEKLELTEQEKNRAISQRKKSQWITAGAVMLVIAVLLYGMLGSDKPRIDSVTSSDSVGAGPASLSPALQLLSDYNNSDQQFDLDFNMRMADRFRTLPGPDRDSLSALRKKIEEAITYKFQDKADSFFLAIQQKNSRAVEDLLAENLTQFGNRQNVHKGIVLKLLASVWNTNKITNGIEENTFTVNLDSSGVWAGFVETGNVLLDRNTSFKRIRNTGTMVFDSQFRLTTYKYATTDSVSNKVTVEVFLCNDGKESFRRGNNILAKLKADSRFHVISRANFKSSTDKSSPYYIQYPQVRYNGEEERKLASLILGKISSRELAIRLVPTRTVTPNYISVFICEEKIENIINPDLYKQNAIPNKIIPRN